MSSRLSLESVIQAIGIPADARVDMRVPKKLLLEQGAPTSADKRAIQDGLDELQWFGACKPTTIGIPVFRDESREYLEIAVVGCVFRPGARVARLIELIHRAIPYPVFLISQDDGGVRLSTAHKRHAQNEAAKTVAELLVVSPPLGMVGDAAISEFLSSLSLSRLTSATLFDIVERWRERIEALDASQKIGSFSLLRTQDSVEKRRLALAKYENLLKERASLAAQAKRSKQMNEQISLNLRIKAIDMEIDRTKGDISGGVC